MRAAAPPLAPPPPPPASARRRRRRCPCPPASASSTASSASVPRVSARGLSRADFASLYDGTQTPVLLTDVFPDADHGAWLAQLVASFGSRRVTYQVQRPKGITELFRAPLRDFLAEMVAESGHGAARFLFDEALLSGRAAPEALRAFARLPAPLFERDGFAAFPRALRPRDACLLAGGAGARSSLHADPYSWTGWNYLIEAREAAQRTSMACTRARTHAF
jgi:hypothetical protein